MNEELKMNIGGLLELKDGVFIDERSIDLNCNSEMTKKLTKKI